MARSVDRGMTKLMREMKFLDEHTLRIGVLAGGVDSDSAGRVAGDVRASDQVDKPGKGGSKTRSTVTQVEVFAAHELGKGVPRRESLGWVMDREKEQISSVSSRAAALVMSGKMTGERALGLVGEKVVGLIQKRIRDRIAPKLSDETIERKTRADGKKADTPLVLFGQYIRSFRWNVVARR